MKRYILSIVALLGMVASNAQTIQASISAAGNPSNVRIWLRPSVTQTPATFGSLSFNIALPASITPIPTLSVVSSAFPTIPPASWTIDPPYIEGGYINYNIYTGASGFTFNLTANTEFMAMEVSFSGGPGTGVPTYVNSAHLVTLPDGGSLGTNPNLALFYCTGTINSDGQNLYYARDASVTIANGDSYRFTGSRPGGGNGPAGTFTSFARLVPAIALPVKFNAFSVVKQDNNGMLYWNVENQTSLSSHFDIERSFDSRNFAKIARKDAVLTSSNYEYNDAGVFDNYSGTVYYRIKQLDRNGEAVYSPVRLIKSDGKGFGLSLYPNPVEKLANLAFSMDKAQPVTITLTDAAGKAITNYGIQAAKGLNQKQLNVSALAAGSYMFIIRTEDESQTVPFVKGN